LVSDRVQSESGKGANFQKSQGKRGKSGRFFENLHRSGKVREKYFMIVKNEF